MTRAAAGRNDLAHGDEEFVLQDTRVHYGNCMVFWAKNSSGYTSNIEDAKVFTRANAFKQHACRDTDRPWPLAYITTKAKPRVDFQDCEYSKAINP